MNRYSRLLVVIDPDKPVDRVLHFAIELAHAHGAVLHICVPVTPIDFCAWTSESYRTQEKNRCLAQLQTWLQSKLAQWPAAGSVICTYPWSESVVDTLLATEQRLEPDLVVKLQEDRSTFGWPLVTPPDWPLLRECRPPLLLLGPAAGEGTIKVIAALDLVPPTEGHSLDEMVIHAAMQFAEPINAEVHLVHAFDLASMQVAVEGSGQTWQRLLSRQRRLCETQLAQAAQRHGLPAGRCHLLEGKPVPTLARLVPQVGDVMVLGRSAHDRLETWAGTTAERVLAHHPACSLLAVGPLEDETTTEARRRPIRERLDSLVGMMFPD